MNSNFQGPRDISILTAQAADVAGGFYDLSRDMDPDLSHVFLDKLTRYATKPDRALFLAEQQGRIIGFATVIDRAPAPEEAAATTAELLDTYACGTGLMVLPEFRHGHVASTLHQYWENWSLDRERRGIWVITRRMAHWYQRCFSYSFHGVTSRRGVMKSVMIKPLTVQPVGIRATIPHVVADETATLKKMPI